MQMSGVGSGKPKPGQGQGIQLPDIKKQEGLGEKMKDGMKKEISRVRDKGQNGKQGKAGQSGQKVRVVKGMQVFWKYIRSKSNYVKHYKTN
jgi:hypothetical protein